MNIVENINEVEQRSLLTTCTTKLHKYYRVNLHFLDFQQKKFPKIPLPPFLSPFITFARVLQLLQYVTEISIGVQIKKKVEAYEDNKHIAGLYLFTQVLRILVSSCGDDYYPAFIENFLSNY